MNEQDRRIANLEHRLNLLLKQQEVFTAEASQLRQEIIKLKKSTSTEKSSTKQTVKASIQTPQPTQGQAQASPSDFAFKTVKEKDFYTKEDRNLEEFVGGNLLSKVGIIITIIGVAIGVKYSIDHDLISPSLRILIGYLFGLSLTGVAIKLKQKYFTYSAVLLSGSLTMLYFITFFAYSLYGLFPQTLSFIIMVAITLGTVFAALRYNRQIISLLGLVGAYAVPFLLSDGSGRVAILLSYMSIINIGILVISFRQKWSWLLYSSFTLSWIILVTWVFKDFSFSSHFGLALFFSFLFFLTFYTIILAHLLIHKKELSKQDIVLLLINSFLFFGIGHFVLDERNSTRVYLGLFTLSIALFHAGIAYLVHRRRLEKPHLFQYVLGLAVVYLTISIPIQLDGNWVTALWLTEATLLFTLGRIRKAIAFEQLAYPLLFLSLISLVDDWGAYAHYDVENGIRPILNPIFLTSSIFVLAFGVMNYVHIKVEVSVRNFLYKLINYSLPAIFIFALYAMFRLEIQNYWHLRLLDSAIIVDLGNSYTDSIPNQDIRSFSSIWKTNYSLSFFGILALINISRLKNYVLASINLLILLVFVLFFLGFSLYEISELREAYLNPNYSFETSAYFVAVRYICYPFLIFSLFSIHRYKKLNFYTFNYQLYFELLLSITVVWVLSSELIGLLNLSGFNNSYKLGLSILWGSSSLAMIILGISQQKKHLRVAAIFLFGVTLIKLFFYDISHLGTIQKTVVFVSLGLLLLVISFLYNKFKGKLFDE